MADRLTPGSESNIWAPDPDPWIAEAERLYTDLGTQYLTAVHEDLHRGLKLPRLPASLVAKAYNLSKAPGPTRSEAMNRAERLYREILAGYDRLPPKLFRTLAEAVTEKWYGEGRLETRAQRRAVAAYLLGLLRAGYKPTASPAQLMERWRGLLGEKAALEAEWAAQNAALHIRHLKDETRHAIAMEIGAYFRDKRQPEELAHRLAEKFGELNRDWRRVALTEVAQARSSALLMSLPEGATVEWSAAPDACPQCKALHGRRFKVRKRPGDPQAEVWPGKVNIGRKTPTPIIPLHPHCRCRFIPVSHPIGDVDPHIEQYVQDLLRAATMPDNLTG